MISFVYPNLLFSFVGHHIPKQERIQRSEEAKQRFTNVYVKNLVTDITEEELKELFGGYGPIASVLIQRDDHGASRGFGFVNFVRHEDAEKAVSQMHDTEYIGRRLFVSRAQKRSEREEELRRHHDKPASPNPTTVSPSKYYGVNLYIKNLADDVDDDVLRKVFAPFGTITSAKVMRDEKVNTSILWLEIFNRSCLFLVPPVKRVWICMLRYSWRSEQGSGRYEWQTPREQNPLRGHGAKEGGS